MLDLFCGRWGWSRVFAARGWECVGVDLVKPPDVPKGYRFVKMDVLMLCAYQSSPLRAIEAKFRPDAKLSANISPYNPHYDHRILNCNSAPFDFICASPPCEQFSVHGMKHFHPNPPYPELGIKLFNHTREICEASGVPYVIENVRAAQQFVGQAVHHCGPFYLWGSGVPTIMPQGIQKGISCGGDKFTNLTGAERRELRKKYAFLEGSSKSEQRKGVTAQAATIPPELANTVADYAERILAQAGSEGEQ